MQTKGILGLCVVLVVVIGGILYARSGESPIDAPITPATLPNTPARTTESPITSPAQDRSIETGGVYVPYTADAYAQSAATKRVLFFHASWCPTCTAANQDFIAHKTSIPQNVVLLKTDYDTEKSLKAKYAITYQHTFVLIDAYGNEVKKWSGGGLDELIANTQ